jgi:glutamate racemase
MSMSPSVDRNNIAIIDYGIGGLGLYRLLKAMNFGPQIFYLSDAGYIPYGKLSVNEMRTRLDAIFSRLETLGIKRIVVACNAASTVLPLAGFERLQILDFIRFGIAAVQKNSSGKVLMFGGERTVRAGVYRKRMMDAGIRVRQKITQDLSIHIEAGDTGSELLRARVKHYLSSIQDDEDLLLACTHYPAITELFRENLKSESLIIDPAPEAAAYVSTHWNDAPSCFADVFFTSGDKKRMQTAAKNAFNIHIEDIFTALI